MGGNTLVFVHQHMLKHFFSSVARVYVNELATAGFDLWQVPDRVGVHVSLDYDPRNQA